MGSSSNTGVRFIDDIVDDTVNLVAGAGKNMERTAQNALQGTAMILSGDWDNAGRTLLDIASLGVGAWTNPDDIDKATGSVSAVQRKKDKMAAKAAEDSALASASELAAMTEEQLRQRRSTISGMVTAQVLSPGRASVLRGNSRGTTNSLLTYI